MGTVVDSDSAFLVWENGGIPPVHADSRGRPINRQRRTRALKFRCNGRFLIFGSFIGNAWSQKRRAGKRAFAEGAAREDVFHNDKMGGCLSRMNGESGAV